MFYSGSEISFREDRLFKNFLTFVYVQPEEEGRRLFGQNVSVANFQSSITFTVYIYKHSSVYHIGKIN